MGQQREQLHRLAQPHVVGEHATQPGAAQEVQPRQPASLIGAQLPRERWRGRNRRDPLLGAAGQQVAEPAVRLDSLHRQVLPGRGDTEAEAQELTDGRLLAAPDQLEPGRQPARVQLDPLAAQPHHRRLGRDQLGQLALTEHLAPDREVVAELGQRVEPERSVGVDAARLAGRRGGQPEPESGGGLGPPAGELEAEPGRGERRSRLAEESVGILGGQRQACGTCRSQRAVQLGVEARGLAELGEERLLRRVDVTRERGQLAARAPDCLGVDHQAWFIGGLQSEVHLPLVAVSRRLDQPEAGPDGARDGVALPFGERLGERGGGKRVGAERAVGAGQGAHPGTGDGIARTAEGEARPAERGARRGVDHAVQDLGPRLEAAVGVRREQRGRGCDRQRARPGCIRSGQHGAPQRLRRVDGDPWQHPPSGDEIRREPDELDQVRHRRAPDGALCVRLAQHSERSVGVELEHGDLPVAPGHRSLKGVEVVPHQLR